MAGQIGPGVKYSRRCRHGKFAAAPAKERAPLAPDSMLASMQPKELRDAMHDLGFSTQSALAQAIGVDRSTVSLWLEGRVGVPRPVAKLVRLMILHSKLANA